MDNSKISERSRVFIEKDLKVLKHRALINLIEMTVTAECITPEGYSECACGMYDLRWELR